MKRKLEKGETGRILEKIGKFEKKLEKGETRKLLEKIGKFEKKTRKKERLEEFLEKLFKIPSYIHIGNILFNNRSVFYERYAVSVNWFFRFVKYTNRPSFIFLRAL